MSQDHFHLVGEALQPEPFRYRACGLDGIFLLNGYRIEEHDGEDHVSITDEDGLYRAIGRHLVVHRKALAPKEVKFLRKTMDLTQAELAERLGNTPQSVARWEKGETAMPGPEEKLLRAIFLASLMDDRDLAGLREFLTKTMTELDQLDQLQAPTAQFELFEEWSEKIAA